MQRQGGSGTVNDDILVGGYSAPLNYSCTMRWNGISWCYTGPLPYTADGPDAGGDSVGNTIANGGYASPSAIAQTATIEEDVNSISRGLYCFVKNLAPGNTDNATGISYSSGY